MKKVTTAQKICIVAVIVLVACASGYVFLFKHIVALNNELMTIDNELATYDLLEQNKQKTVALLESTDEMRNELQSLFVSINDPTPFLESIEATAFDANATLEVETLRVEDLKEDDTSLARKEVIVTLNVEGKWNELYRLISLLETIPYISTITNATFSLEQGGDLSQWSGQMQLRSIAM